jgi:REP element-mobilizing transposase RayT
LPRPPRLEFPGALYHVTARGNERRAIFRDDEDREEYLARIAHYRGKFRFQLLAYCLMSNHVHLAMRPALVPLSRIMAGLHSSYADWFNRRHNRVGHLFQGRYKAYLVQEDRYLHALVRYIHRNPVHARIVSRCADYEWSSDRFLRRGSGPDWLDVDPLLSLLDRTRRLAVRRYIELVDDPPEGADYRPAEAVAQAVIGDSAFATARFQEVGDPDQPLRGIVLDRLLDVVARESGLTVMTLRGPRCGGEAAAARCRAAYLARRYCGIPVRRVARNLGRDDSAFTRPLARLEARLQVDQQLQNRMRRLLRTLAQTEKSKNQD